MYQILGFQQNGQEVMAGTAASARGALTQFRAVQGLYPRASCRSPDGDEIDGFELNRRAMAEQQAGDEPA